jgi:Fe-S cluster assembly iron-binding protein IscA
LGHVREQDVVVKADGVPLLLVEAALIPVLKGATLDYREEPEGRRLTLKI